MRKIKLYLLTVIALVFLGCQGNVVMNYHMDECELNETNKTVKDYSDVQNDAIAKHGSQNSDGLYAIAHPGTNEVICGNLEFRGEGYNADPNNAWYYAQYYLEAPDNDDISPLANNDEMTMSGWFKTSQSSRTMYIIVKPNEYGIYIENGDLKFIIWNHWGSEYKGIIKSNVTDGKWHFYSLAVSYDNIWNELDVNAYYGDGTSDTLEKTTYTFKKFGGAKNTDNDLYIGAMNWNGNITQYFDGYLDELGMYDSQADDSSVEKLYKAQKNHKDLDEDGNEVERKCPVCTASGSETLKPVIDFWMDECSWDDDLNTYEVNNSGTLGDGYNATAGGEANVTYNGKIYNDGNFTSSDTNDKYLLLKNSYKLSDNYAMNVWIKFPLDFSGHKNIATRKNQILYKFNIADRVGSDNDYIYFKYFKSKKTEKFQLCVKDDKEKCQKFDFTSLNGWHMLTFNVNGSDDKTYFYLDANNELNFTECPTSGDLGLIFNSDYYSNDNQPNGQSLGAEADEFEIYGRVLSNDEIKNIYNYENNGSNYDGTTRNPPNCEGSTAEEVNSTFNAVDYIQSGCNAQNDWDDNITTKLVAGEFNLSILSKDPDSGDNTRAKITKVDLYVYQTPDCSGNYEVYNVCDDANPNKECNLTTDENGCGPLKNVKYASAARCVKVHIRGKALTTDSSQTANEDESNSTDAFAVRPEYYKIDDIDKNLTAGKDFTVLIKAYDADKKVIGDFNFSDAPVEFDFKDSLGCKTGDLNSTHSPLKTSVDFINGEANVTLNYTEVGDLNISVKEYNDSNKFAGVDEKQEDNATLLIGEGNSFVKHFNPAEFKLNAVYNDYDTDNNFTYLDDDVNVFSHLELNITAVNADGNRTENYNKDCYAKDVDINISHDSPDADVNSILYKYKDASGKIHGIFEVDKNDEVNVTYSKENFDGNGTAKIDIYLNFDKNYSNPVNPFEFNITKIDVNDTNASGHSDFGKSARYYYGNLVLTDILAVQNDFNKTYSFVLYDENESDTLKPESKEILFDWYENIYHQAADGNVSNNEIVVSTDYNASNTTDKVTVTVNKDYIKNGKIVFEIDRKDTSVNFVVVHLLSKNLKWLWYSKFGDKYDISSDSTCLNHFCFTITWQKTNDVGEVGSGNFAGTEANVTESNTTKRGVKIFR